MLEARFGNVFLFSLCSGFGSFTAFTGLPARMSRIALKAASKVGGGKSICMASGLTCIDHTEQQQQQQQL